MSGKGSKPRPMSIPREEYDQRWGSINWSGGRPVWTGQADNTIDDKKEENGTDSTEEKDR